MVDDEWLADPHSVKYLRKSALRNYQTAVRPFCDFVTDPNYGWAAECERRFGTPGAGRARVEHRRARPAGRG
jgi:hypothetical protein